MTSLSRKDRLFTQAKGQSKSTTLVATATQPLTAHIPTKPPPAPFPHAISRALPMPRMRSGYCV